MSGIVHALMSGCAVATVVMAEPAFAQDSEVAALRALVDKQARQIENLSTRLRAVEARNDTTARVESGAPRVAAVAPAPLPAPTSTALASSASASITSVSPVSWDHGVPSIESADGRFSFRPRLRVLADGSTSSGSRFSDRNISGTELRLVRLGADGGIDDFAYRAEIDFAGDEVTIRDAWFGYEKDIGLGDLRLLAGNKLNDRSLDGATSLTSIPFAERNTVANLIAPQGGSYGVGVFASLASERGHLSLNVKGEGEGSNDGTRNDSLVVIGRGHVVPLRGEAGFLHLGGWGLYERINDNVGLLAEGDVEGSNFNQNIAVLPGLIRDPRSIDAFGVEAAGVVGSAWFSGEYGERHIRTASTGRFKQDAWSLSGGLFLTGEAPPLSNSEGVWHRPEVRSAVTDGGLGAFELLLRYDREDQTDAPFGGRGSFATLGANWYLNNWAGFKLNLVRYNILNPIGDFPGRDRGVSAVIRGEIVF